jgi:hypothetical protein
MFFWPKLAEFRAGTRWAECDDWTDADQKWTPWGLRGMGCGGGTDSAYRTRRLPIVQGGSFHPGHLP